MHEMSSRPYKFTALSLVLLAATAPQTHFWHLQQHQAAPLLAALAAAAADSELLMLAGSCLQITHNLLLVN